MGFLWWKTKKKKNIDDDSGSTSKTVVNLTEGSMMNDAAWLKRLMSHNLRMPMTLIKGYSDLLAHKSITDPAEVEDTLEKICRNVDFMNDVLKVVLDNNPSMMSEKEEFMLLYTLRETSDFVRTIASRDGIRINIVSSKNEIMMRGNRLDFMRAFFNMFENSLKYMETGTVINVAVEEEDGHILIIYKDDGAGMDENLAEEIFKLGIKGDKSNGSGLGMYLVGEMVRRHNGTVKIKSSPGAGFRLEMDLPNGL